MFFVVTGTGEQGARSLVLEGVRDVLIADADGLQHAPPDFDRLFVTAPTETRSTS